MLSKNLSLSIAAAMMSITALIIFGTGEFMLNISVESESLSASSGIILKIIIINSSAAAITSPTVAFLLSSPKRT